MKFLPILIAGLFAGLVIGSWQARAQRRTAERALQEAEARLRDAGSGDRRLDSITGMLRIDERQRPAEGEAGPETGEPDGVEETAAARPGQRTGQLQPEEGPPGERQDLRARIEQAADIWTLRAALARSAFIERTALSAGEVEAFDVLTEEMNLRIRDRIATWSEEIQAGGALGAEDGARLIHDLTGILVSTYDGMNLVLDPSWREGGGDEFDLIDLVDPMVAEPLVEVEGLLRESAGERRGRRAW